eukprot:351786-Chlamydomonas_euryale.AAC.6
MQACVQGMFARACQPRHSHACPGTRLRAHSPPSRLSPPPFGQQRLWACTGANACTRMPHSHAHPEPLVQPPRSPPTDPPGQRRLGHVQPRMQALAARPGHKQAGARIGVSVDWHVCRHRAVVVLQSVRGLMLEQPRSQRQRDQQRGRPRGRRQQRQPGPPPGLLALGRRHARHGCLHALRRRSSWLAGWLGADSGLWVERGAGRALRAAAECASDSSVRFGRALGFVTGGGGEGRGASGG